MSFVLKETELLKIKSVKKSPFEASFIFDPLSPGYGITIGHTLRRILLSSLEGAAVWSVRINGVTHEFSTLPGIKEDIVEIILNLKTLRLKLTEGDEATIKLSVKGPAQIKAKDFQKNSQVEIIDPEHYIATLDKTGKLELEATIRKGRGYIPTEARKDEKLPLGTIALDANFTPIKKINYEVQPTRVEDRTDFDKLILDITTDGTVKPEDALKTAASILADHTGLINQIESETNEKKSAKPVKKNESNKEKKSNQLVEEKKDNTKIKSKTKTAPTKSSKKK